MAREVASAASGEDGLLDVRLAEVSPFQRWYLQHERFALGLLGFVVVLIVWEMAVRLGLVKLSFMSSPSKVVEAAQLEIRQGRIWLDIWVTLVEFTLGYLVAAVVGIAIGLVAGWFKRVNYLVDPWLAALYATPDVALVPLIVLVLGIDLPSKVFVVFLTSLFSVAINTLMGVHSTETRFLDVARCFGASQLKIFSSVVLPGSVPYILTGLRLAAGRALVGVVLAELIASNKGLGFVINQAGQMLNTGRLMLAIVLLGTFGVLIGELLRHAEQHFDAWRPQRSEG
jgi:ABC-type nitrate/sulfonate/bicarbonate transport system permease component